MLAHSGRRELPTVLIMRGLASIGVACRELPQPFQQRARQQYDSRASLRLFVRTLFHRSEQRTANGRRETERASSSREKSTGDFLWNRLHAFGEAATLSERPTPRAAARRAGARRGGSRGSRKPVAGALERPSWHERAAPAGSRRRGVSRDRADRGGGAFLQKVRLLQVFVDPAFMRV
jgi:hypothetical protein